jgi:hemoglobin
MRLPHLFGFGLFALALLVTGGMSQDQDKKEEKKEEKKKEAKKKDGFMTPFKGIEFSPEQTEKIAGVRKEFKPKLDELTKKVNEMKKAELDEVLKLLTAEQRKIYDENTAKKKGDKTTLWDRLGGEKNVTKVLIDFQKAAGADPKVNASRDGKFKLDEAGKKDRLRVFVEFVSSVTGGPLKYTGRSMKDSHKGLGITDAEFDAAADHFKTALEKNGVAPADVADALKIWNGTRKDIVETKKN